ncbi:hypothetical protein [Wenjunlia tyrosinilytica]|uniref:hypothetical protein n=1 Tax=Wenjunlia tyrosinilytica TaxID=1544741 RepID=UPI0027E50AA6|nr:hypothetical protein [Wenjunlia tyrosinilytica]
MPARTASRATHPGPGRPGASRSAAPAQPRAPRETARIELIPASTQTALDAADEVVDRLLDAGRTPGDILVLATGDPHPWESHELSFGEESYWRQHDEGGDVFYARAGAERASRRAVVVLAVNGGTDEAAAQALPSALERAAAELIVVGDPERLRALVQPRRTPGGERH